MRLPKLNIRAMIFGFMLLVLSLPGINLLWPIIKSGELEGAVVLAQDTSFTTASWLEGSYQHQKEKFLNDNIGFRVDLVRINNQLDYSLFRKVHAADIVIGKDNQLFEKGYIESYYGEKYIGDEKIAALMHKLRFIQDSMNRAGKAIVLAFAPSKARYYPECFPENMVRPWTPKSNYLALKSASEAAGINAIDFNGWYLTQKATTLHPLFSKMGIHWTHWGADHVADSLNHRLEQLLHIDMPDIEFGETICTTEPRGENDVERGLNIIWPIMSESLCYNQLSFHEENKTKPSVIIIGDSFFWSILGDNIPQRTYRTFNFWNYFSEVWDENNQPGHGKMRRIWETDWKAKVAQSDAIVLFYTEVNLARYADEFIDEMYKEYGGK
jgi:hypothetical protein